MSVFEDFWKGITGETAAEENEARARKENLENQNKASAAKVFAETEGMGIGNMGHVAIGGLTDEDETTRKRKVVQLRV